MNVIILRVGARQYHAKITSRNLHTCMIFNGDSEKYLKLNNFDIDSFDKLRFY